MTCFMCKGDMRDELSTFTADAGGCVVIIKGVPSHVCTQCGEIVYDDDVFGRLEKMVADMKDGNLEVAMAKYDAA